MRTTFASLLILSSFVSAALGQGNSPVPPAAASNRMVELKTSFKTTKEITITAGSFLIVTPSEDIEVPAATVIDEETFNSETTLTGGEEYEITLVNELKLPKGSRLAKKSKVSKPTWDILNAVKFGKTVYAPSAPVKAADVDRSLRSINDKIDNLTEAVNGLTEKVDGLDKRVGALEARPVVVRAPATSPETARPLPPPPAAAVIYNVDSCGRRIYSSDGGKTWYYCP